MTVKGPPKGVQYGWSGRGTTREGDASGGDVTLVTGDRTGQGQTASQRASQN